MDQIQHSHLNLRSTPELQNGNERTLVVCGLWLVIGFMGASAVATGIRQLFDGQANWLVALMLVVCGGIVTAASWHRARAVLDDPDQASAIARQRPPGVFRKVPPAAKPLATSARRQFLPGFASTKVHDGCNPQN